MLIYSTHPSLHASVDSLEGTVLIPVKQPEKLLLSCSHRGTPVLQIGPISPLVSCHERHERLGLCSLAEPQVLHLICAWRGSLSASTDGQTRPGRCWSFQHIVTSFCKWLALFGSSLQAFALAWTKKYPVGT